MNKILEIRASKKGDMDVGCNTIIPVQFTSPNEIILQ
jgi:hypothetical protein